MTKPVLHLIAGPTASGKSAFALETSRRENGTIINADAMQVYAGLPILTAQPSPEDKKEIPHELYEVFDPTEKSSAGKWLALAEDAIERAVAAGRTPILVGGTGLYFKALLEGLADIPDIPESVRRDAQKHYEQLGPDAFREELAKLDPESAARIKPNDRQRLIRAYEVAKHTGKPIGHWQTRNCNRPCEPPERDEAIQSSPSPKEQGWMASRQKTFAMTEEKRAGFIDAYDIRSHILLPPREELYAACDRRFLHMMERGAVEEVRALLARKLDPELPAMKILGVREIGAFLRGEITREEAIAKAQQATRNYAKRQMTWFRNQWGDTGN